jgi:hypothetical protein
MLVHPGAHFHQFPSSSFSLDTIFISSTQDVPHATTMALATRRVSPTLYPTPPPSASFSTIAGPSAPSKPNARHYFSAQQPPLASSSRNEEDDGTRRESRVSRLTAQLVAQTQLCSCPWRCNVGCDALLGSIDLLQRVCFSFTFMLRDEREDKMADEIACETTFACAYTHVHWLSMPLG